MTRAYLPVGTPVFVNHGTGVVTRVEGYAESLVEILFGGGGDRLCTVYRDAENNLAVAGFVSLLSRVEKSWYLVKDNGEIVHGGPRTHAPDDAPSLSREQLEADRDNRRWTFLEGSHAVFGVPPMARVSSSMTYGPFPGASGSGSGEFLAAGGGAYLWRTPPPGSVMDPPVLS